MSDEYPMKPDDPPPPEQRPRPPQPKPALPLDYNRAPVEPSGWHKAGRIILIIFISCVVLVAVLIGLVAGACMCGK
jgi:hypothetical protein